MNLCKISDKLSCALCNTLILTKFMCLEGIYSMCSDILVGEGVLTDQFMIMEKLFLSVRATPFYFFLCKH